MMPLESLYRPKGADEGRNVRAHTFTAYSMKHVSSAIMFSYYTHHTALSWAIKAMA